MAGGSGWPGRRPACGGWGRSGRPPTAGAGPGQTSPAARPGRKGRGAGGRDGGGRAMSTRRGGRAGLERAGRGGQGQGRCESCPPISYVTETAEGVVVEGAYPQPCSKCGGPHDGLINAIVVRLPPGD